MEDSNAMLTGGHKETNGSSDEPSEKKARDIPEVCLITSFKMLHVNRTTWHIIIL